MKLVSVPCDFYEICGTKTYVKQSDLVHYDEGYMCAECFDQQDMEFLSLVGWEQYNVRYAKKV